eukprot:6483686-Amphidinium_carterae.1
MASTRLDEMARSGLDDEVVVRDLAKRAKIRKVQQLTPLWNDRSPVHDMAALRSHRPAQLKADKFAEEVLCVDSSNCPVTWGALAADPRTWSSEGRPVPAAASQPSDTL